MKKRVERLRGMHDILPDEYQHQRRVIYVLSTRLLSAACTWITTNSSHCRSAFSMLDRFFAMKHLGAIAIDNIRNWALSFLVDIQPLLMLKFCSLPVICCKNSKSCSIDWSWGISVLPAASYNACILTITRRACCLA